MPEKQRLKKQWIVRDAPELTCAELQRALDLHPVVARLLAQRGMRTPAEALEFLNPCADTLPDPFLLPDAAEAVDRILYAVDHGQTIFVHGDYDVDGITSAALFTRVLMKLGANVTPFVPCRSREGYGVHPMTVRRAHQDGAGLLLTCDCGITAHNACEEAAALGLDVVVTDHHEPNETLPCATAVVNPMRKDCSYPFRSLAGVGVAYKICQALCARRGINLQALHKHYLDLVALGTVSDCVPLLGENRIYVHQGLKSIGSTRKAGLRALMESANMGPNVDAEHIGFILGPRINAAGRLAEASEALELFLTQDRSRAVEIAQTLSERNVQRKREQDSVFQQALEDLEQELESDSRVLVLGREGWHPGIIGIVAGKLSEAYYRPAFVLSVTDGVCHGSGRSIPGFNLARAIEHLGKDLISGGGHAMAAGVSFPAERMADVKEALNQLASQWLTDDAMVPRVDVDMELDVLEITRDLGRQITRLAPFGEDNAEPVFVSSDVQMRNIRTMGADGHHFRAELAGTRDPVSVVGFGMGEAVPSLESSRSSKICYNLRISRFNGVDRTELMLYDAPQINS